jgi:predicted RNA-binding Zn-ribbon protein involved in translation (DUF1610 family)
MDGGGDRDGSDRRPGSPRISSVAEELRLSAAAGRSETDLHICPRCGSELVQPVRWAPVDMRRWRVDLACPECAWSGGGVYPQPVLDRFDEVLDDGIAAVTADLERLERTNMEEDVNRFLDALFADGVLPEDF